MVSIALSRAVFVCTDNNNGKASLAEVWFAAALTSFLLVSVFSMIATSYDWILSADGAHQRLQSATPTFSGGVLRF